MIEISSVYLTNQQSKVNRPEVNRPEVINSRVEYRIDARP